MAVRGRPLMLPDIVLISGSCSRDRVMLTGKFLLVGPQSLAYAAAHVAIGPRAQARDIEVNAYSRDSGQIDKTFLDR